MGFLTPRLLGLLAVVVCLFGSGWLARGEIARRQVAELKASHADTVAALEAAARKAVEDARAREDSIMAKAEEVVNEARQIAQQSQLDAAAADTARVSLLDAAKKYYAGRCPGASPTAAGRGQAAGASGDLFFDLYARTDAVAGEMARHADAARSAGLACERIYSAAREALK